MPTVPTVVPTQIDAQWLTDVLRQSGVAVEVANFTMSPVGAGQIGDTFRFALDYAPGSAAGPATIIGKFATNDPTSRQIAATWSLYEREVRFYRDLAFKARVAVPICYGTLLAEDGSFALLLEDLAPAKPGDQIAGMSSEDAERAMIEAARLHAAFWDQGSNPDLAWLESGPLAQPFYAADVFRSAWAGFRERYDGLLSETQQHVCAELARLYDAYIRPLDRPRCVTHNDYRPDNMLFGPGDRLKVVDWQSAALGHNAVDVAYLIGGAFAPEDRRANEKSLLAAYHQELLQQGVQGYDMDDLIEDYRHFAFAGINVAVGAAMLVKRTERGDRMFLTMLDRHVAHVRDWDSLAILESRN